MSERVSEKRAVPQIQPIETKRQDLSKKISKPGRKPTNAEPKNRRTAQNRAAQRAYRERKEKKMKELEDKVQDLENENKVVATESEFLRMQVAMLRKELSKYKGDIPDVSSRALLKQFNDSKAPTFDFPWSSENQKELSKDSTSYSESLNSYKGESSLSPGSDESSSSSKNKDAYDYNKDFDEKVFCESLNSACGTKDSPIPKALSSRLASSSTTVSTPNENAITPVEELGKKNNDDEFLSFMNNFPPASYDSNMVFNLDGSDKILDNLDFLNEEPAYRDGHDELFNNKQDSEFDPIKALTTEDLSYDVFNDVPPSFSPAGGDVTSESSMSKYINSPATIESTADKKVSNLADNYLDDDDNAVVPAKENEMYKCSEIWDRVTSHPKYGELDIDGLCTELKAKAKCSDKGALIKFADVEKLLPEFSS